MRPVLKERWKMVGILRHRRSDVTYPFRHIAKPAFISGCREKIRYDGESPFIEQVSYMFALNQIDQDATILT